MKNDVLKELEGVKAYWRAANYLSAGQIFLKENALLKEPLKPMHIKPRLMGHWGTCPGLNLIWAHSNRLIRNTGMNAVFIAGPGHGAPAVLACTYLDGNFTEHYPSVTRDEKGMAALFRAFSSPGGMPSHVSPLTPGSFHEGGELGYCLSHAFGAVFDEPELTAICVIGDGEAESGPLEGSWKSIHFLNPERDGSVLPVLHLNGYKIASPTIMGRYTNAHLERKFSGEGYSVLIVEGETDEEIHQGMATAMDKAYEKIVSIKEGHGSQFNSLEAGWPLIILKSPKGWTGPEQHEGKPIEGSFRSHQVPLENLKEDKQERKELEKWMRAYGPEQLFDTEGNLTPLAASNVPPEHLRMGGSTYANGGKKPIPLMVPDPMEHQLEVSSPGISTASAMKQAGEFLLAVFKMNRDHRNFRLFCPDEASSNKLDAVFKETSRCSLLPIHQADEHIAAEGRVLEVLSEHLCQGWLEGYLLTGKHGLFATYEAFAPITDSMLNQFSKWLKGCSEVAWRKPLPSMNYLLSSHCWRQDHNGYSHQAPGFINNIITKKNLFFSVYLPADANTLIAVLHQCFSSSHRINVVVAGKQPEPQWLNMAEALEHVRRGASVWEWASNCGAEEPDIVLACCGDVPTLETIAAVSILRELVPDLSVRAVNVVNLMSLATEKEHGAGLSNEDFLRLFGEEVPVVFNFHGFPGVIEDILHRRPNPQRFYVKGYREEGTTTTPFDMTVLNGISRYHVAMEAVERSRKMDDKKKKEYREMFEQYLQSHQAYIREHLDDMPEIKEWKWQ